jgi:hypothetical protein
MEIKFENINLEKIQLKLLKRIISLKESLTRKNHYLERIISSKESLPRKNHYLERTISFEIIISFERIMSSKES